MPERRIRAHRAHAEKARDTTLDDEKYNWRNIIAGCVDRTCVVVMTIFNQPEAFTLLVLVILIGLRPRKLATVQRGRAPQHPRWVLSRIKRVDNQREPERFQRSDVPTNIISALLAVHQQDARFSCTQHFIWLRGAMRLFSEIGGVALEGAGSKY